MMNFKMKMSKKGITLVESVFAVVILGIMAIGILSLLSAGGVKIGQISQESRAHAQAVQKMDLVISAVSNGSNTNGTDDYIIKNESTGEYTLNVSNLKSQLGLGNDVQIAEPVADIFSADGVSYHRGWYLSLTYNGATVNGYASNTEGVFDRDANVEEN